VLLGTVRLRPLLPPPGALLCHGQHPHLLRQLPLSPRSLTAAIVSFSSANTRCEAGLPASSYGLRESHGSSALCSDWSWSTPARAPRTSTKCRLFPHPRGLSTHVAIALVSAVNITFYWRPKGSRPHRIPFRRVGGWSSPTPPSVLHIGRADRFVIVLPSRRADRAMPSSEGWMTELLEKCDDVGVAPPLRDRRARPEPAHWIEVVA
jgi:hypothetical protein